MDYLLRGSGELGRAQAARHRRKPVLGIAENRGSTPPIRTDKGWLVLYHGVDEDIVYRVGAMLLDLEQPEKIIARTHHFIMEPETYYEKFGFQIPNVIFPTGNVVKDGLLYIYYGVTDTAIALATVPLDELVEHILREGK